MVFAIGGQIRPSYWEYEDYFGRGTEREYLPVTVLYDPYGDKSYQKITSQATITTTIRYKAGGNVVVLGGTTTTLMYTTSYQSSVSTNPADMGPGKGDRIIGKVYDLTWDVYEVTRIYPNGRIYVFHKYILVSSSYIGTFINSRSDLQAVSDTRIVDKTGTVGGYRHFWDISANTPVSHAVAYSWSGEIGVGFEFNLNLYGLQAVLYYSLTFSGTQAYSVTAYYENSASRMTFYENADYADPAVNTVYSYVFWYS